MPLFFSITFRFLVVIRPFGAQEIEKREIFGPIVPHLESASDIRNYQGIAGTEEEMELLRQALQPDTPLPPEIERLFEDF